VRSGYFCTDVFAGRLAKANRLKPAAMIVNSSFYEGLGVASLPVDISTGRSSVCYTLSDVAMAHCRIKKSGW